MSFRHEDLYRQRFSDVSQGTRAAMWEVLCRVVLQRHVPPTATVVDLGAGFCEFINTIHCGAKIAVDTNPAVRDHAAPDVRIVSGEIPAVLAELGDASADVVFCSNFFEHLPNKDAVLTVLRAAHRILVPIWC